MLSEVVCGEVEDGKGSETIMKGFALKASMSEMVSLGEGGDKTEGVKVFLARGCRENVLVIKDKVGSVNKNIRNGEIARGQLNDLHETAPCPPRLE